jgi:hypothetical protein
MLNPIHTFTDNFSKFHVNQSTNEGAIQVTTYFLKNLLPSSPKSDPLTDFSENQSHPCFYYYWELPKVSYISINKCRRYSGDNILWHMDGLTDGRVKIIISTQLHCVGYNDFERSWPRRQFLIRSDQRFRKYELGRRDRLTDTIATVCFSKVFGKHHFIGWFGYMQMPTATRVTGPPLRSLQHHSRKTVSLTHNLYKCWDLHFLQGHSM